MRNWRRASQTYLDRLWDAIDIQHPRIRTFLSVVFIPAVLAILLEFIFPIPKIAETILSIPVGVGIGFLLFTDNRINRFLFPKSIPRRVSVIEGIVTTIVYAVLVAVLLRFDVDIQTAYLAFTLFFPVLGVLLAVLRQALMKRFGYG